MQSEDTRHLLVKVAEILDSLNISYLVTGGIAVLIWGRPRFTADIDLVVEVKAQDLAKLQKALKNMSPQGYIELDAMKEAIKNQGEFNFIDAGTGIKVDFWILTDSLLDKARFKRRKIKNILNKDIYFTSPEDLILIKLKWYKESESSRQREDVESILKITENLDKSYIEEMAQNIDLLDVWLKIGDKQ